MSTGKFANIAGRSRAALQGLGAAALRVEFAHGNLGKAIYALGAPEEGPGGVKVALRGEPALCKPGRSLAGRNGDFARAPQPGTVAARCC